MPCSFIHEHLQKGMGGNLLAGKNASHIISSRYIAMISKKTGSAKI